MSSPPASPPAGFLSLSLSLSLFDARADDVYEENRENPAAQFLLREPIAGALRKPALFPRSVPPSSNGRT